MMVRPSLPMFEEAQASPIIGTRAAPISIEGFKNGGSPTPNIPFLANEVGAEAFYNLATEQLEPLGNGQPGVYTTSAPGVVIPNTVLPQAPALSIPQFPAVEQVARVAPVQSEPVAAPYTLGQNMATTMPEAPVAMVDSRPALPDSVTWGSGEGQIALKPNQYMTPGKPQYTEGVTTYGPNPNATGSTPSAMPAAPDAARFAANRENAMKRYEAVQQSQRTGQNIEEMFAAPAPLAMAEMTPQESASDRKEYQRYLNTPQGRAAYNEAQAKAQKDALEREDKFKLAKMAQDATAERAKLQREQSLAIAEARMQESAAKAATTIALTLDEKANKQAEKEQAEAREMRDAQSIGMNFAKDLEADGDAAGAARIINAVGTLNTAKAIAAEVDYARKLRDDKRKADMEAKNKELAKPAAEPAFTPVQSEKIAAEYGALMGDATKWKKLAPEEQFRIKAAYQMHTKNAFPQAAATAANPALPQPSTVAAPASTNARLTRLFGG
jgi:hypothetical protein